MDNTLPGCPLCKRHRAALFYEDNIRPYFRCDTCDLIFVPQAFWLDAGAEKAEYDLHQNHGQDEGYRHFLSRLVTPLCAELPKGARGLDFGCGADSPLADMMVRNGHETVLFDKFYHPDPAVLETRYDFITATEVVEHFQDPAKDFATLFSCLKPGGRLGIMTKRANGDVESFGRWHYIRDLTHLAFYSLTTFEYLAGQFGADVKVLGNDTLILEKKI